MSFTESESLFVVPDWIGFDEYLYGANALATGWNDTFANLTVQVDSQVEINSIPQEVTAGQSFTLSGRILDGFDSNRSVRGPMAVEVFFLNDSSEKLVSSQTTTNNGSFSVSVPTDPFGDGVSSGTKTVVVSVIEGSSPFYLTGTANASILLRGVTRFTDRTPIIQTVVDRGTSITFGARLTEFSDNDLAVGDMEGYIHLLDAKNGDFLGRKKISRQPILELTSERDFLLAVDESGKLFKLSLN